MRIYRTTISIPEELFEEAKRNKIKLSQATRLGILLLLNAKNGKLAELMEKIDCLIKKIDEVLK